LKLGYQGGQIVQVGHSKMRSPSRYDKEEIFGLRARPACRQRRHIDHAVRFGVVESVNATIKGVIRRPRGMRDENFLLLKLKWATARPIGSARDYARFLGAESLYSNR
jgi:hypothetical protein